MEKKATIKISRDVRGRLKAIGRKGESYDDVLRRMFEERETMVLEG